MGGTPPRWCCMKRELDFELKVDSVDGKWYVLKKRRRGEWIIASEELLTKRQAKKKMNQILDRIPEIA